MWNRHSLTFIGLGTTLAVLIPLGLFQYYRNWAVADPIIQVPYRHFVIVSLASGLAALIAAAIGLAGWRHRNIEVTFVSLGFMSLAVLFGTHGLATPGFLLRLSPLPGVAAQLSILVAAVWLALSSTASDASLIVHLSRRQGILVPVWAFVLFATSAISLARPHLWHALPIDSPPLVWAMATATMLLLVVAAVRYWQSYTYSRFPLQLAMVYATGWLAAAQWIMLNGILWHLSWWLYHFLFVAATLALVIGIVWQYAEGTSLVAAVRGLFLSDPVDRLEAGLSRSVRALVTAMEVNDPYVAGHSYRVTLAAVHLAEAMGLSADKLRALAQGGVVHDVGKIETPGEILNKAASLTPSERAVVERHPLVGYAMCKRLGFRKEELEVVRHHHERWNGTGYPDKLAGDQIPLLARILAITDVYDALTSSRPYRGPWSLEEARAYILREAGRQFDPRCVDAWAKLIPNGSRIVPMPAAARRARVAT